MKRVDLVQGSKDWVEFRRTHIGASDSPIIMGKSPWKTPLQLWEEKILGKEGFKSEAMQRGNDLEEMVRRWASNEWLTNFEPAVFVHEEHDWLSASLDGISSDGKTIIEIKCPGEKSYEEFVEGKIPEFYNIQMQHQMLVSGLSEVYLLVSDGTLPPLQFFVNEDLQVQQSILQSCKEFRTLLLEFTPPIAPESTIVERTDSEWAEAAENWCRAKETLNAAEEFEEEARQCLRYLAGEESARGAGVSLTKSIAKGNVDYSKIPELKGVDLEKYRKAPVIKWTPRIIKTEEVR